MWKDPDFDIIEACKGVVEISGIMNIVDLYPESSLISQLGDFDVDYEDIIQGKIGDCWLLSALSAISYADPNLIESCLVYHSEEDGISCIRLGNSLVYVDHFIPVVSNDKRLEPVGARLSLAGEYWPMLFEKAFVKLFASSLCPIDIKKLNSQKRMNSGISPFGVHYIDIHGGFPRWALSILVGAQVDPIHTAFINKSIYDILKGIPGETIIACACTSTEKGDTFTDDGFVYGHAYSVLSTHPSRRLIRVRNPWGIFENTEYDDQVDDGAFWIDEDQFKRRFPVFCLVKILDPQKAPYPLAPPSPGCV